MHRISSRLVAPVATALAVLGFAVTAQARNVAPVKKPVVVASGTATLTPTKTTATFLATHHVTVTVIKPATLTGGTVTLPAKGAMFSDSRINGVLFLRGGVIFATATKTVKVRGLTFVHRSGKIWLAGLVNGHAMILGRLTNAKHTVSSKQIIITGEIHLTASSAKAVDKLVGKHLISAGYDLGGFTTTLNLK